jgi:hypothetical protein
MHFNRALQPDGTVRGIRRRQPCSRPLLHVPGFSYERTVGKVPSQRSPFAGRLSKQANPSFPRRQLPGLPRPRRDPLLPADSAAARCSIVTCRPGPDSRRPLPPASASYSGLPSSFPRLRSAPPAAPHLALTLSNTYNLTSPNSPQERDSTCGFFPYVIFPSS